MSENVQVYSVDERLDAGNVDAFKAGTSELLESGCSGIVIDFSNTKFIDSIGLGSLVSILKVTGQTDKNVALCTLSPQVRQIFELTRLYRLFEIFDNVEDASVSMS